MAKKAPSTEQSREALLRRMTAGSGPAVEATVPFQNNDVPEYLRELRRFEDWSRKSSAKAIIG